MVMTKEEYAAQGKKNRRIGAKFERDTRKDMEDKGWIVDKWSNNVDLDSEEIVKAKLPFSGGYARVIGTGFPDFVIFHLEFEDNYKLIFVECKINGKLSKTEKLKMNFLIKQGHNCFVAYKDGKEISYKEFLGYEDKS